MWFRHHEQQLSRRAVAELRAIRAVSMYIMRRRQQQVPAGPVDADAARLLPILSQSRTL